MFYREWTQHFLPRLTDGGVAAEDARVAIDFGWLICVVDQRCFPERPDPVSFRILSGRIKRLKGVVAIHQAVEGSAGEYQVFPVGLSARIEAMCRSLQGIPTEEQVLFAMAAHEVRHRVQAERPALIPYDRLCPGRADVFVRTVMQSAWEEQLERIETAHNQGQDEIARLEAGWKEYDAAVVERLVLHLGRQPLLTTIATIVLADAPR